MNVIEYYSNTLKNAFSNIGSLIVLLVIGYLIFFKLPFLFFLRNMKKAKNELNVKNDQEEIQSKIVGKFQEPLEKKSTMMTLRRAEALFNLAQGEKISKEELKKRYRELLKMNHPDKVASLSPEFKDLAHKKTKEINDAYDLLMSKLT